MDQDQTGQNSAADDQLTQQQQAQDNSAQPAQEQQPAGQDYQGSSSRQRYNDEQTNFAALRESKRRVEQERDQLSQRINELEKSKSESTASNDQKNYEDEIKRTREELNNLKSQWNDYQSKIEVGQVEKQLTQNFPDYEKVATQENIEKLKEKDGRFAKLINKNPESVDDLYNRAVSAYTLIKKYGLYVQDEHEKDRDRVDNNLSKPRPVNTAQGSTPSDGLADFAEFSNLSEKERQKAIFKLAKKRANEM